MCKLRTFSKNRPYIKQTVVPSRTLSAPILHALKSFAYQFLVESSCKEIPLILRAFAINLIHFPSYRKYSILTRVDGIILDV